MRGHLASRSAMQASALTALANGGYRTLPGHVDWDASGRCTSPYLHQRISEVRPTPGGRQWAPGDPIPYSVKIAVPCRRCASCLRYRGWSWSIRCQSELKLAQRTWFTTLTAPPEIHDQVYATAFYENRARGFRDENEEFRARCAVLGRDVTLFFKKLRKNTRVPFRYVVVAEEHEDNLRGLPHYHALIHETTDRMITWRELRNAWAYIDEHKLVYSDGVAGYATKYMTKSMRARVRASIGYGLGTIRSEP